MGLEHALVVCDLTKLRHSFVSKTCSKVRLNFAIILIHGVMSNIFNICGLIEAFNGNFSIIEC